MARRAGTEAAWLVPFAVAAAAAGFLAVARDLQLGPSLLPALLALAAGLLLLHCLLALQLRQTTAFLVGLELAYGLLLLLRSHAAPLLGLGLPAYARLQAVSIPLALGLVYSLGRGGPLAPRAVLCAALLVALPFIQLLLLRGLPGPAAAALGLRLVALPFPLALPQVGIAMLLAFLLLLALRGGKHRLYDLCLALGLFPRYLLLQQAAAGAQPGFSGAQRGFPARAALCSLLLLLGLLYGLYRLFWERAFQDELTGLGNRRSFEDALRSPPRRFALAMIDIDHFKAVNDTYGHAEGDQVLRWVAAQIKRAFGAAAYRYGGEEFSVLLPDAAPEQALGRLEALRQGVAEGQFVVRRSLDRRAAPARRGAGQERRAAGRERRRAPRSSNRRRTSPHAARRLRLTVSIGLAAAGASEPPAEVLHRADAALYRAKEGGRNRVVAASATARSPAR